MQTLEKQIKVFLQKTMPKPVVEKLKSIRSKMRTAKRSLKPAIQLHDLEHDLRSAGIKAGDIVMVHSSLSSIGNVEGGAQTVVQSLMNVVTESGAILMPAYSPAAQVFGAAGKGELVDLREERSGAGKITEVFRTMPGVLRSSHPFSSICAWGKNAEYLISGHALDSRICHKDSPIGRLLDARGKIIGLGTTLGYVSFYHSIEDIGDVFPFDTYLPEQTISYIDSTGAKVTRPIRRYNPEISKTRIETEPGTWVRRYFEKEMAKHSVLKRFSFGNSNSWIIDARGLYDELKEKALKGITIYTTKEQGEKLV